MPPAAHRTTVVDLSVEFAWSAWSDLGLAGIRHRPAPSVAADPEALLLFTLEAARHDPRLFDEVLDWLLLNGDLVSVQRARNLCRDHTDRRLLSATLAWVAKRRPRARLQSKGQVPEEGSRPLFYGMPEAGATEDSFAHFGLRRVPAEPSGKSAAPDLDSSAAFAFRLRRLFGVSVRAEVVRVMLSLDAPRVAPAVLTRTAGFSGQNVREATAALFDAGVAHRTTVGSQQYYSLDPSRWHAFLGAPPRHRDWIQLLGPLRIMLRFLADDGLSAMSAYMRASAARALVEPMLDDLRFAGVAVDDLQNAIGTDYWISFETLLDRVMQAISRP